MSSIVVSGDTSGTVTISAPAVAGTPTLTLPTTSGTILTTASTTGISGSAISTGTVGVSVGGTGRTTNVAYSVVCGGTTTGGAEQSVASVGTSGQVLTSGGAGALPTWTTISSTPTTAQVLTATAGATGGSLGTYLFGYRFTGSGNSYVGTVQSGTQIWPASCSISVYDPTAQAGTWQCMGYANTPAGTTGNLTLWLRVT
jgi:hypothetical protein